MIVTKTLGPAGMKIGTKYIVLEKDNIVVGTCIGLTRHSFIIDNDRPYISSSSNDKAFSFEDIIHDEIVVLEERKDLLQLVLDFCDLLDAQEESREKFIKNNLMEKLDEYK